MLSMWDWSTICCRCWTGQRCWLPERTSESPLTALEPLFRLPTSASKLDSSSNLKIQPKSPKKLRKPFPRPSQNASQIATHVPTHEMFKNDTTMVRKPHFRSCKAFRNRFKIDAKTPSNSALCWIQYPLGTIKNTIFDVKTSPRWIPQISFFF